MAILGMDTDLAHTQLAQLNTQGRDAIHAIIGQLDGLLNGIADNWKGSDAQQFHGDWQSTLRAQLTAVHDALDTFGNTFNQNIQAQIDTSSHL